MADCSVINPDINLMKGTEYHLNLARNYFEQSNQHNLDTILPMFDDNATYNSSQVGSYEGKEAIGEMMKDFFVHYPDVFWEIKSHRPVEDNGIEFIFMMRASNINTGEHIERQGLERITFTLDNLISHIEVSAHSA